MDVTLFPPFGTNVSAKPPSRPPKVKPRREELSRLLARISAGKQEALTTLYDQTSSRIYGLLRRILGHTAAAEEALLDVYLQVWRQAADYDADREDPITWLVLLARECALRRLRDSSPVKRRATAVTGGPLPGADPGAWQPNPGMSQPMREALALLSPVEREVIELAYFSGITVNQIASHLGQPEGVVRQLIGRGMMKLRDRLRPCLPR